MGKRFAWRYDVPHILPSTAVVSSGIILSRAEDIHDLITNMLASLCVSIVQLQVEGKKQKLLLYSQVLNMAMYLYLVGPGGELSLSAGD